MASPRTIILDTFPLSSMGLLLPPSGARLPLAAVCQQWILDCLNVGNPVFVPAICYYETLREWERINAYAKIQRLQNFCFSTPERFLRLERFVPAENWQKIAPGS